MIRSRPSVMVLAASATLTAICLSVLAGWQRGERCRSGWFGWPLVWFWLPVHTCCQP